MATSKTSVVEVAALSGGITFVAGAIAAILLKERIKRMLKWRKVVRLLDELRTECDTSVSKLTTIAHSINVKMLAGLARGYVSQIKMIPTYIRMLPQGREIGNFYGLDFGGTYYRIVRIELGYPCANGIISKEEKHLIPDNVKGGTCEALFDFIALELKKFVESEGQSSSSSYVRLRELGFSFSFPIRQTSVSTGSLIGWTKGLSVQDGVDSDVAVCLQLAMDKIGLHMRITALVNDTVGTFCYGHYQNQDTAAAVSIGTGTSACYMERVNLINRSEIVGTSREKMAVNVEWGSYSSPDLPRTSYDASLDADSINPNEQGFEKMISGMYLGEIVRRVIVRMLQVMDMELISDRLSTPFTLSSECVAEMNEDETPNFDNVARVFRDVLAIPKVPLELRRAVVEVCDIVGRRAARLVAAGIVGVLKRVPRRPNVRGSRVVVLEGGVYNGYAQFRNYLEEAVTNILGEVDAARCQLISTVDSGAAVGAALTAAHFSTQS